MCRHKRCGEVYDPADLDERLAAYERKSERGGQIHCFWVSESVAVAEAYCVRSRGCGVICRGSIDQRGSD